jgi:hypothetical protein
VEKSDYLYQIDKGGILIWGGACTLQAAIQQLELLLEVN